MAPLIGNPFWIHWYVSWGLFVHSPGSQVIVLPAIEEPLT